MTKVYDRLFRLAGVALVALACAASAGCGDPVADDYVYECTSDADCADGYVCMRCEGSSRGRCVNDVEDGCGQGEFQSTEGCRPWCEAQSECPLPGTSCTAENIDAEGYCSCLL